MRRRQCGFALFKVKEDTFCQVKQLKNYPEELEARDTSQFFVTSEALEPVKFLESSPPHEIFTYRTLPLPRELIQTGQDTGEAIL